jgi:hypothetical protein
MSSKICNCGHEKRDHNIVKSNSHGSCKICLCNSYQAVQADPVPAISVPD